jgi:hypothetical protein
MDDVSAFPPCSIGIMDFDELAGSAQKMARRQSLFGVMSGLPAPELL